MQCHTSNDLFVDKLQAKKFRPVKGAKYKKTLVVYRMGIAFQFDTFSLYKEEGGGVYY